MRIKIDIEYLIIWKNLQGLANPEEQKQFELWLSDSRSNQVYYQKLRANYDNGKIDITPDDLEQSWKKINKAMLTKEKQGYKRWLQYAAAIIVPLAVALAVFQLSEKEVQTIETAHQIQPGSSKAMLKLANGEYLELDAESETLIRDKDGQVIGVDSMDILSYSAKPSIEQKYNTITIPRGGEYQLVLADGTKVWLNSESSLTYPVSFNDEQREVYLTGEAYFDVTSNKDVPFLVKTATSDVKVYGTQFNVMAYESDNRTETTLVEGSVAVLVDGTETLIEPGQQAQVNKATKAMFVNEVNVDLYTAWKDGVFRFEEMTLQQMADKLGRWYDVDFFFANEDVKGKRFTGAVRRETNFEFFINLIEETTQVKIDVKDKTVLVKALY
ncbi:FecR family protein [Carboxylicivirga sp. RSCT41]|uniref:FecR family protein n=1 Tax=Carboxylicivirga agarovorans TaxID=3417570 RepID=UPI003D343E1A